jgi:hypothetical protein
VPHPLAVNAGCVWCRVRAARKARMPRLFALAHKASEGQIGRRERGHWGFVGGKTGRMCGAAPRPMRAAVSAIGVTACSTEPIRPAFLSHMRSVGWRVGAAWEPAPLRHCPPKRASRFGPDGRNVGLLRTAQLPAMVNWCPGEDLHRTSPKARIYRGFCLLLGRSVYLGCVLGKPALLWRLSPNGWLK